jgi:DNA end-binding protein Ku
MPRAIWKGAISIGLVYVPVALYPASESIDIATGWTNVDGPGGLQRINKNREELERADIVKGSSRRAANHHPHREEIRAAYPKSPTIEVDLFVKAVEIPFTLSTRRITSAACEGEGLRAAEEAMLAEGVVGVAQV